MTSEEQRQQNMHRLLKLIQDGTAFILPTHAGAVAPFITFFYGDDTCSVGLHEIKLWEAEGLVELLQMKDVCCLQAACMPVSAALAGKTRCLL